MTLTDRQRAIFEYVRDYIATHQYAPSVHEIARWFRLGETTVRQHLDALERKGAIERTPATARSLRIPQKKAYGIEGP